MKAKVTLYAALLFIAFSVTVYIGLQWSQGRPVPIALPKRMTIKVPFKNLSSDLAGSEFLKAFDDIPAAQVTMKHQVTIPPWTKELVSPVTVKVFHNKDKIFFCMKWADTTQNTIQKINDFTDGCAVMFAMGDTPPSSTIMMGFMGQSNIWQWKASQDNEFWMHKSPVSTPYVDYTYPFEDKEMFPVSKKPPKAAVNDLSAERVATLTPNPAQAVQGRGIWAGNAWQVVFERSLNSQDRSVYADFVPGNKKLCAFAVWNGASQDRGGRKSISDLIELEVTQ